VSRSWRAVTGMKSKIFKKTSTEAPPQDVPIRATELGLFPISFFLLLDSVRDFVDQILTLDGLGLKFERPK
jgi:hypothetical protein